MSKRIISITSIVLVLSINAVAQTKDLGREYFFYDRFASAAQAFHAVVRQDVNDAEGWYWLTRTLLRQGKTLVASDSLALAPASVTKDAPYMRIAKGAVLLAQGRPTEARTEFDAAVEDTKGKNAAVLAAIADVEIEVPQGDPLHAIELLQGAVKRDKKNAALYTSMGKAYRKMHKGTEAYQALTDATDRDRHAAEAYYELGGIFLSQKNAEMYTEYFNKALAADSRYAPAHYALYNHYLYRDAAKASDHFLQYTANADPTLQQEYSYTDLLYLNKKYDSAILSAKRLIDREGDSVQARLYKLLAYSYQEKKDSVTALGFMQLYFHKEVDSNFVMKDFENMGLLYANTAGMDDSALYYFEKAVGLAADEEVKRNYYQRLAQLSKKLNRHDAEAHWLGQMYLNDPRATNVTLFNWGLAAFKAQDFVQADSVFGLYTEKYPEQGFGYYWRARSNAAIDTSMAEGLAIPHYQKLIEKIDTSKMTENDRKWMREAYGYMASYEANTNKDYPGAIEYFEKLLEIDPGNEQAKKNIDILEKNLQARSKTESGTN